MGDISAEPSMEDILSSIKRIIAEEGDAATAARGGRKPPRPAPSPSPMPRADIDDYGDDEILELSDRVGMRDEEAPAPQSYGQPVYQAAAEQPRSAPPSPVAATAPPADPILSPQATIASRSPLEALSRMVVKPEIAGSDTLEGMVREMVRPMLRDWLDANLPAMVEAMVAREISRITGQQAR